MSKVRLTGGCQCGAIRYAVNAMPLNPHICHCRMCQKAFGAFYAPLAGGILNEDLEITRGALALFNSSDEAERGFCSACGTPLTFRYFTSKYVAVSIGSLDDPAAVKPIVQYGVESRVPFHDELPGLPAEAYGGDDARLENIRRTNHQHPDHDTDRWPSN
ncbi:MAG: GFA family protein [Bauldia sp.]